MNNSFIETTLILIKPDGVRRGLTGTVLSRFERTGLKVVAMKIKQVEREFAEKHYTYEDITVRHGEKIRKQLLEYVTEGPLVAVAMEGVDAVAVVRKITGSTEPSKSAPGTIRGDYCHHSYGVCDTSNKAIRNVIHASASVAEATTELELWFDKAEFVAYKRSDQEEHYLS